MNKRPVPHPFNPQPKSRLLKAVSPSSIGALSAATLALYPKLAQQVPIQDALAKLPGSGVLQRVPNKVYLALVGFIAGYSTAKSVNWLRWSILRSLFTYIGWVRGGASYKNKPLTVVQAWAMLIKLLRGPGPYDTFAFQPHLPKQPLPELDATLDTWLKVAKHILSVDDFEMTKEAIDEFRATDGPKVQAYLVDKARKEDNWVSDYWLNLAYLASRDPIAVNHNYYVINCGHETLTRDPIARAAATIHCQMEFQGYLLEDKVQPVLLADVVPLCMAGYSYCKLLEQDTIQPIFLADVVPLCMAGYGYLFNTVRVPGETIDSMQRFPSAKHIVVIRKGHYFKLNILAPEKPGSRRLRALTVEEIYQQLDKMQRIADALPEEPPVSALTSQNRSVWAKHREVLKGKNEETLALVESAMFIVCLDDYIPKDTADHAHRCLTGAGNDRWFDKCFTSVISASGIHMGWNTEHSVIDAMVFGTLTEHSFITEKAKYNPDGSVVKDPKHSPRQIGVPDRLEWDVTGLEKEVDVAHQSFSEVTSNLDLCVTHPPFGKGVMKKARLSPDGFIQMGLQLAYYRMHKEIPKTYEPSTSRIFLLGRTETVHPVSSDSVAFVKAMDDPQSMNQSRKELLRRAVKQQTKFRLDATAGEGCDRHLLALFCASRELGMDIPKLFMDKAWRLPFKLSTSQTPTKIWDYGADLNYWGCAGGFGPGCSDGYGVSYVVLGDEIVNIHITSWKSCEDTDSKKFAETLGKAFEDMKTICFQ